MILVSPRPLFRRYPFTIPEFVYRDCNGRNGRCKLEVILARTRSRIVVIATELQDNPAMSITNAAEIVASQACRYLDANPLRFVWIEHYGYSTVSSPPRSRTYDRVNFRIYPEVDLCFSHPQWQTMTDADWRELDLEPRLPEP